MRQKDGGREGERKIRRTRGRGRGREGGKKRIVGGWEGRRETARVEKLHAQVHAHGVCVCLCACVRVCVRERKRVGVYVRVYVCMRICANMCVFACAGAGMRVCVSVFAHYHLLSSCTWKRVGSGLALIPHVLFQNHIARQYKRRRRFLRLKIEEEKESAQSRKSAPECECVHRNVL